jgi:hypothetical protein
MTTLGKNVKITAPETARDQARATFEAFGAKLVTPRPGLDVFPLEGGSIAFEYIEGALTESQMRTAPWLEFAVADVAAVGAQLDKLGLARLDYWDKAFPYFVGPAGVVFRLTALTS